MYLDLITKNKSGNVASLTFDVTHSIITGKIGNVIINVPENAFFLFISKSNDGIIQ